MEQLNLLGACQAARGIRDGHFSAEDLVQACIDHAGDAGILLVGDLPYFGRFGFRPAPDVRLAGPVDQRRVLWRGEGEPKGPVVANRALPPSRGKVAGGAGRLGVLVPRAG